MYLHQQLISHKVWDYLKTSVTRTKFLDVLETESAHLDHETRHQMWSMLLRGGAVLVFKAWLGHVKDGENQLDKSQFDELSDLLFIKTRPEQISTTFKVDANAELTHIFFDA